MKNTLSLLIMFHTFFVIQVCVAMESQNLSLIKQLNSIPENSYIKPYNADTCIAWYQEGCVVIDIKNDTQIGSDIAYFNDIIIDNQNEKIAYIYDSAINILDIKTNSSYLTSCYPYVIQSCDFDCQKNLLILAYDLLPKKTFINRYDFLQDDDKPLLIYPGEIILAPHPQVPITCIIEKKGGMLTLYNNNLQPLNKTLALECDPKKCQISPNGIAAILHSKHNKISLVNIVKETLTKTEITCPNGSMFHEELFFYNDIFAVASIKPNSGPVTPPCLHFWNIVTGECIFSLNLLQNSYLWNINFKNKEILLSYDKDQEYALFSIAPALKNKFIQILFFLKNTTSTTIILPKDLRKVIVSFYADCFLS